MRTSVAFAFIGILFLTFALPAAGRDEERRCRLVVDYSFVSPSSTKLAHLEPSEPSDTWNEIYGLGMGFGLDLEVGFCPAFAFMLSIGGTYFFGNTPKTFTDTRWSPIWTYEYHYGDVSFLPVRWGGRFRLPFGKPSKEWFDTDRPGDVPKFLPYLEYLIGFTYMPGQVTFFIDPYDWDGNSYYGQKYIFWERGQVLFTYSISFGLEFELEKNMQMFLELEYASMDPPETSDDADSESEALRSFHFTFGLIIPL